jgi:hypothetical protein
MTAETPAPRRYGKRKLPDAREKFVAVRCSVTEHAAITAAAAQAGLAIGPFLRSRALGAPGPRSVRRPPADRAELARLLGALGKLGGNVNQIAYAMNATGDLPSQSELAAITDEVRTMRGALLKALGHGD